MAKNNSTIVPPQQVKSLTIAGIEYRIGPRLSGGYFCRNVAANKRIDFPRFAEFEHFMIELIDAGKRITNPDPTPTAPAALPFTRVYEQAAIAAQKSNNMEHKLQPRKIGELYFIGFYEVADLIADFEKKHGVKPTLVKVNPNDYLPSMAKCGVEIVQDRAVFERRCWVGVA